MKDTDHHIRHPRGHLWRSSKCPRNKRLRMARRSIWTRAKHRVGLERPHFCTRFRAQSDSWVAPAQSVERGISLRRVLPTCPARIRTEQVKRARITFFSFVFTRLFTL